jgi:transcription elongation factor Elf1
MRALADTARFRATDPDPLVSASFACPVCLHGDDIECDAALDGYDPSVQCRCPICEQRWQVFLAPQQALRFGLMATRAR